MVFQNLKPRHNFGVIIVSTLLIQTAHRAGMRRNASPDPGSALHGCIVGVLEGGPHSSLV